MWRKLALGLCSQLATRTRISAGTAIAAITTTTHIVIKMRIMLSLRDKTIILYQYAMFSSVVKYYIWDIFD